jgi:predicted RNase H-like HicB family nuclease
MPELAFSYTNHAIIIPETTIMAIQKASIPVKFRLNKDGVDYEFERADEGGYVVRVPLYPSCVTEGDTFEEALSNAEDALLGCLLAAKNLHLPVPTGLKPLLRKASKR